MSDAKDKKTGKPLTDKDLEKIAGGGRRGAGSGPNFPSSYSSSSSYSASRRPQPKHSY